MSPRDKVSKGRLTLEPRNIGHTSTANIEKPHTRDLMRYDYIVNGLPVCPPRMAGMTNLCSWQNAVVSKGTASAIINGDRNASGIVTADKALRGLSPATERKQETMKVGPESPDLFEYNTGKELLVRLRHGTDLVRSITELARSKRIEVGSLSAIGALKSARLGYYDQKNHEYREIKIDSPHELASCVGNISLKDGEPFVHVHAVLADQTGNTKAGHLLEGIVFAAEVHLHQLEGPKLERKYEEATGLSLWEME
jgi:predicted DNA-binding protein with PD1-like motif